VIFGAFQQSDGTLSRQYGGTGLGLSIANEVSALLGGRITAVSDLGRGSTFTLWVPTVMPDGLASGPGDQVPVLLPAWSPFGVPDGPAGQDALGTVDPAPAGGSGAAVNVLVFEGVGGGHLTLLAHSAISDLTDTNAAVRVVAPASPAQAVALLAAEPFRCVVVDLGLPAALEFLEQAREKPELAEIPVVAHLTGRPAADVADRVAALRAGYRTLELLSSLDDLRERITLHLSAARPGQVPPLVGDAAAAAAAAPTAGSSRPGLRGKHILVIDDDARTVFAIKSTLELYGMRATVADNGRQGIDALIAARDVDLILMDVMMPRLDGYSTMTTIRQMPRFGMLPIIAVTARAMPGDRDKSLTAGASDYVTKPVDTEELLNCMERWLPAEPGAEGATAGRRGS
jgi:CheY-like chemotaxis protein